MPYSTRAGQQAESREAASNPAGRMFMRGARSNSYFEGHTRLLFGDRFRGEAGYNRKALLMSSGDSGGGGLDLGGCWWQGTEVDALRMHFRDRMDRTC